MYKIKFEKPYLKQYRRVSKITDDLHNRVHHDDSYSLWFHLLPSLEIMYFSYGKDHRYNFIDITFEWLFWGVSAKVNIDKKKGNNK